MISSNYDLNEFLVSVGGKDYSAIIHLANKEATEAERIALRSEYKNGKEENVAEDYADNLKELLFFLIVRLHTTVFLTLKSAA